MGKALAKGEAFEVLVDDAFGIIYRFGAGQLEPDHQACPVRGQERLAQ